MGYYPTEYAEFTEPPAEMSSHGFHRSAQILRVRCSPTEFTEYTEFGSVGMAGMPYPPTSVLIRVICGSPFSARGSVYSVFRGNLFPPTDFSLGGYGILPYPRHLLWDILPQNTPNSQNLLLRCPPTDFTDLHRYLGCAVLPQNSQNLAAWVWQGCHTLLRYLEPSLLHILPVLWVRLRHHLRLVDAQPGEHDCRRCERHRHAVVVVGVDRL